MEINKIYEGECLEVLKTFPDNSVDSCVSDPPAGISFMSKKWDDKGNLNNFQEFIFEVFSEVKRVLKPGGHILVWALPRTSHHTAMGIERAGFEIRDCVYHVFAQGFPKSLNVGKAVNAFEKTGGSSPRNLRKSRMGEEYKPTGQKDYRKGRMFSSEIENDNRKEEITNGWEGWGTCLKPAVECWWLCRKPISEKTITENVLKWGVGGINIDGCRISYTLENPPIPQLEQGKTEIKSDNGMYGRNCFNKSKTKSTIGGNLKGRFPSNLILDGSDEVNSLFPNTKSGARSSKHNIGNEQGEMFNHGIYGKYKSKNFDDVPASEGSASRFFYCAKTSTKERNIGFENGTGSNTYNRKCLTCGKWQRKQSFSDDYTCKCETPKWEEATGNNHPTVKPISLMRYLCKLITPKNGIILDPFLGSGSTAIAAKMEEFNWIGIEKEPQYVEIAKKRIAGLE